MINKPKAYKKYLIDYYETCVRPNPVGNFYYSAIDSNISDELSLLLLEEENIHPQIPWEAYDDTLIRLSQMNMQIKNNIIKPDKRDYVSLTPLRNSFFIEKGLNQQIFQIGNVTYDKTIMGFSYKRSIPPKSRNFWDDPISMLVEAYGLGTTNLYDDWVRLMKNDLPSDEELEYM